VTLRGALALAIALLALAIGAGTALAQAPEPQTSLPDVEDEVMCPVCGTTLELASESPQAIREREFIRDLIAEGRTKEEIKAALVAEFGDEVLALPEDEGFDLAAWIVPGLAIVTAAIAILIALRRWRRASGDGGPGPAPEPLDAEDAGRLEAVLERYRR
jgi:cytochrome c-type biogenesis protein CcmH